MPSIELQAIVPKGAFQSRALVAEIEKALREEVKQLDRLYRLTYMTWSNKPAMHKEVKIGSKEAFAEVSTDDRKMLWLDDGTKFPRHAKMSQDWVSKTKVNRLRSGHGRGRLARVSRQVRMPGIKPRNWTKIIARMRGPIFVRNVENAVKRAKVWK